jgi:outer membrane protein assembly factor BamD
MLNLRRPRVTSAAPAALAICLAIVLAALPGCSLFRPKVEENTTAAVEKLYEDAQADIASGNYESAVKTLERVEGRAAGTLLAQQALLDLAYTHWKSADRVQALAAVDRFIKLHPSSPALDYALYLKGLINFNDNVGLLGWIAQQNISERDQQASRDAYQSFKQLVDQFPNSRYAPDSRQRMDFIVNALADYEVHVARYYLRRGAYLSSVNRAQSAVREYPQSPAVEEALWIMVQAYDRLSLPVLRDDAQRVLKLNYPESRYLGGGGATTAQGESKPWWKLW